jgi:RND family efflux transporter MFP subunit
MDPMMKPYPAGLMALAAALILSGCSQSGGDGGDPAPVALVQLDEAQTGPIQQTVSVYGTAAPSPQGASALTAPAESIVVALKVGMGAYVQTGQIIAQLQPSPATRQAAAKAQADAAAADAALARAKRLRAEQLASDADVETALAAAKGADAAARAAADQMHLMTVMAPQSGYVSSLAVKPGDQVAAGASLASLTSATALNGNFGVDPRLAAKLHPGDHVRISTSDGGVTTDARILSVSPVVDAQSRLAPVITDLPAGPAFGAGQPLRAEIVLATQTSALSVPYVALQDDGGQPFVYVVKAGTAHRVDVVTGPQNADRIAILKGLSEGDKVVTQGGTALEDGMKVRLK